MTKKKYTRWTRRTGYQTEMLHEYVKLGYKDEGLSLNGALVMTKPCGRQRMTVIAITRKGKTKIRGMNINDHPHYIDHATGETK